MRTPVVIHENVRQFPVDFLCRLMAPEYRATVIPVATRDVGFELIRRDRAQHLASNSISLSFTTCHVDCPSSAYVLFNILSKISAAIVTGELCEAAALYLCLLRSSSCSVITIERFCCTTSARPSTQLLQGR